MSSLSSFSKKTTTTSNNNNNERSSSIEPSWSPMMCLPRQPLTLSGLLQLDVNDGEVELIRRKNMELRSDNGDEPMKKIKCMSMTNDDETSTKWIDRNTNLTITITTHRIVFMNNNNESRFLHHSNVLTGSGGGDDDDDTNIESRDGGRIIQFKSPKILIKTSTKGNLLLIFRPLTSTSSYISTDNDREEMIHILRKAINRRAWEDQSRIQQKKMAASGSSSSRGGQQSTTTKVGVDAILAKNAQRHKEAAKLTNEAFDGDAETLLREATELVRIIEKYVSTIETQQQRGITAGGKDKDGDAEGAIEDTTKLSNMLQDMGMTSALEKTNKDDTDYYVTLAKQIVDFIKPHLSKNGGLMTLTDVYCYFNRARGTNLISPEDLLKAIDYIPNKESDDNNNNNTDTKSKQLPKNIGITTHTFIPSGVRVLQDDTYYNDEIIAQKLITLASSSSSSSSAETTTTTTTTTDFGDGITSLDVSRSLHISPILANEQLLSAERLGYLCRDVTLETTRFFPNKFFK